MTHDASHNERLLAYLAGDLGSAEAQRFEAELATDPEAARLAAAYRAVAAAVQADAARPVPEQLIARAKAIFQPRQKPSRVAAAIDRIRAHIAELTYDSRVQPALAGVRGEAQSHQLSYQAGEVDIDLQLDPIGEGDDQRWRILGQISGEEIPAIQSCQLTSTGSDLVLNQTDADEHAMFSFDLEPGTYDLFINVADEQIVLQGLRMP
jgi:hypothetical protein